MARTPKWRRDAPHVALALDYAADVVAGRVDACLYVRQACQRQLDDLEREGFPYVFDLAAAERVCAFIETMPHVKGEWAKRRELIRLEPWQCFYLTTIFGWLYAEDVLDDLGKVIARAGQRRFRSAYIEVPRKNAKSAIAAAIGLYMESEDGEAGAEVYSNATTAKQARLVFDVARQMAKRATDLEVRAHNIADPETGSKFEALHAQGETLDGYNIHCAINDELHAWKRRAVYDVIETAMGARQQPLMFNITTAGDNLEGICYDIRGYCVRLLQRTVVDESFFSVIYTIDEDDRERWLEVDVWRKANPNWGVSVSHIDMQSMANKAREVPSEQSAFLTKRLNVWVNSATAWMDMVAWHRQYDPRLKLEGFAGEQCWAGIDLASKIDVNSLVLLFRRELAGKDHYYAFTRHWLPEAAVRSDRFGQYDGWVRMGALRTTPGNVVNVDRIEEETQQLGKVHRISSIGLDPGHNSTQYGVHMAEKGFEVVDVRPTVMNFSEPMKWLEAWVKDGTFHHCCPVLTWMVSNVVAFRDQKDNIYPRKENVTRKIDGLVALLMAISRMQGATKEPTYNVFFV